MLLHIIPANERELSRRRVCTLTLILHQFQQQRILKKALVGGRLQRIGAIRSPETGFGRGMGGKERTLFFDNCRLMLVR